MAGGHRNQEQGEDTWRGAATATRDGTEGQAGGRRRYLLRRAGWQLSQTSRRPKEAGGRAGERG